MTEGSDITQRIKNLGGFITLFPKQHLTSISIDTFLCDDVIYRGQDFAGAPLEQFPMVEIFQLYDSNQQVAFEKFHRWMREWLFVRKGWKIPKRKGGMAKGSLYTLISELYRDKYQRKLRDFDCCDRRLVDKAIALRARHYFVDVYESIKNNGYDVLMGSPITCVRCGDAYMIKNGHHRAAALLVLGLETVMAQPI
jgi:hypothetical protein